MKKKLIQILIILIAVLLGGTVVRREVKNTITTFNEAHIGEDTIADLSGNPYFAERLPGYRYRALETITYPSAITGTNRHAMVFLPADYTTEKQYPVLYLLHGINGSHRTWRNKSADIILQNLYYFNDIPEMIVVCPNCVVNETENADHLEITDVVKAYDLTGREVVENLMPYINSRYPVKPGRENTAIAGNSMGGRNALYTAFTYPELFGYVGAFSSAHVLQNDKYSMILPPLLSGLALPDGVDDFNLLFLCVGRSDRVCGEVTYELDEYMTESGIDHIFYDTAGGHSTAVWQNALYNFARHLFVPGAPDTQSSSG